MDYISKQNNEIVNLKIENLCLTLERDIAIDALRKIVAPYNSKDDINCLSDVIILAQKALDTIYKV
jgi:hypothetical protein